MHIEGRISGVLRSFSVASYKSLSGLSKFDKSLRLPMPDEAR
jgi:hypothetical protein